VVLPHVGCVHLFGPVDYLWIGKIFKSCLRRRSEKTSFFSPNYWPIPEKVFEAVPFLHGMSLPLVFVGIMTFVLIMSSVTMVLAVEAGHRMDQKAVEKWMLWTILGGMTFLGCQAWEWTHFIVGTEGGTVLKEVANGAFVDRSWAMHGA